jgi:hypothetical protein
MSLKIQGGIVNINEYHDNSREYNINAQGKDLASVLRAIEAEDVEPIQAEPVQSPSGELFKYIHPSVTDDNERLQIHREVANLVQTLSLPDICKYLWEMKTNNKVYLNVRPEAMFSELHRMGMPDETNQGFSKKNFMNYFNLSPKK